MCFPTSTGSLTFQIILAKLKTPKRREKKGAAKSDEEGGEIRGHTETRSLN